MVLRDYTNLKNKQIWVFKGGISPSGLSPLALYADYPFIIRSYAIYIGQEKTSDGTSCHDLLFRYFSPAAYLPAAEAYQYSCNHIIFNIVWTNDGV